MNSDDIVVEDLVINYDGNINLNIKYEQKDDSSKEIKKEDE